MSEAEQADRSRIDCAWWNWQKHCIRPVLLRETDAAAAGRAWSSVDRVTAVTGVVLGEPGEPVRFYWVVLEGEMQRRAA